MGSRIRLHLRAGRDGCGGVGRARCGIGSLRGVGSGCGVGSLWAVGDVGGGGFGGGVRGVRGVRAVHGVRARSIRCLYGSSPCIDPRGAGVGGRALLDPAASALKAGEATI